MQIGGIQIQARERRAAIIVANGAAMTAVDHRRQPGRRQARYAEQLRRAPNVLPTSSSSQRKPTTASSANASNRSAASRPTTTRSMAARFSSTTPTTTPGVCRPRTATSSPTTPTSIQGLQHQRRATQGGPLASGLANQSRHRPKGGGCQTKGEVLHRRRRGRWRPRVARLTKGAARSRGRMPQHPSSPRLRQPLAHKHDRARPAPLGRSARQFEALRYLLHRSRSTSRSTRIFLKRAGRLSSAANVSACAPSSASGRRSGRGHIPRSAPVKQRRQRLLDFIGLISTAPHVDPSNTSCADCLKGACAACVAFACGR